jgi:general secretion pathway protein J
MTRRDVFGEGSGHAQAGFALVELLVAMTLMTFLSAALLGSIRFGITAWGRGTERSDQVHTSMVAQNLVRGIIESAYPLFLPSNTGGNVDFAGSATSLQLLAPVPLALGAGGRARITFSVEQRGGRSDLLMAAQPELADRAPDPTRKTLLADLDGADFAYFGRKRTDKAAQWHDAWSNELALPAIVRVRARFAHADARLWPDLLVAPRVLADVGCVYDALTKLCRGR